MSEVPELKPELKRESWSALHNAVLAILAVSFLGLAGLAYVAYNTLEILQRQQDQWHVIEYEVDQKAEMISELRGALGYGGFIHNFKNLVLRQDKTRIPKIEAGFDAFQDVITQYVALLPDATEAGGNAGSLPSAFYRRR